MIACNYYLKSLTLRTPKIGFDNNSTAVKAVLTHLSMHKKNYTLKHNYLWAKKSIENNCPCSQCKKT